MTGSARAPASPREPRGGETPGWATPQPRPARGPSLAARRADLLAERLGEAVICDRCRATYATYSDRCTAPLDEACPGFKEVDSVALAVERELGLP